MTGEKLSGTAPQIDTEAMRTAISIPDAIFAAAEEMAERLGISQSQLYAKALKAFLAVHQADDVTRRLNEVYATEGSRVDPVLATMQALCVSNGSLVGPRASSASADAPSAPNFSWGSWAE